MITGSTEPKLEGVAIADTAIRQPVFITMMVLLAIVVGLLAYSSLPVNFFPDFSVPNVSISVNYSGADPQTMADQVAKPIEDTLMTISGVQHITTNASQGSVQISVEFAGSISAEQAIQDVREKVNAVAPRLPSGADDPVYQKFDPNSQAVLQIAVTSDGSLSPLDLRELMDSTFAPEAEHIEGVGSVDVSGGQQRQINVLLDLNRLQALHLAPSQVSSAIRNANSNLGLGSITSGDQTINLRAPSQITSPEDIANIPIAGTTYIVGDIATVEDGVAESTSYARLDGQDAVTLGVRKQSGANTASVAEGARNTLEQLFAANPRLKYLVISDQSIDIRSSVESSIEEIVLAVVAAMLVVLLFFRDIRNTLVTVAGLPVIMIFTFAGLWLFGITINVISLLALSLSVGLVIDDAIVVRENIFRFMERGDPPKLASSRGTAEVSLSVLAMTLTIIAVFLPVALVSGTTGVIFKSFGITVAVAMGISLIEAFTFAPMLSATLFTQKQVHHHAPPPADGADLPHEAAEELGWLGRSYERLLHWTLRHRWAPVALTVLILVVSVIIATGVRVSFLPPQASETVGLGFQMPPGASLVATDRLARQAEAIIMQDPSVVAVQTSVNSGSGSFTIRLHNSGEADAARERIRPQLSFLPELALSAQSFGGGTATGATSRNVQLQIQSSRPFSELVPIADQIVQAAQNTPGLTDIGTSYDQAQPELEFKLRNSVASAYSLSNNDISSSIRALINGDTATTWQQDGNDVDVVVRLPAGQRADIDTINALSIPTNTGAVPLASVADVTSATGPTSIRRYDRLNEIVVGANVAPGYDQNQLQTQLQAAIAQLDLPGDVYTAFGGQTQNQNQGFSALFTAMGLSVLLVYIILASQFASFTQPLVIMLAMPFSFLGAFVALRLAGMALDITGLIGLIMLLGLVVKNSILVVDFTNQLRRAGMDKHAALERAGAIRLRPILMTSTAVVAGALPTALGVHFFSGGEGGEFRQGLAIVVVGGMLTSTLLTLLVVPTAYSLLDSLLGWLGRLLRWRPRRRAEPALATVGGAEHGIYEANGAAVDGTARRSVVRTDDHSS